LRGHVGGSFYTGGGIREVESRQQELRGTERRESKNNAEARRALECIDETKKRETDKNVCPALITPSSAK
jgi:hypothetical protein